MFRVHSYTFVLNKHRGDTGTFIFFREVNRDDSRNIKIEQTDLVRGQIHKPYLRGEDSRTHRKIQL